MKKRLWLVMLVMALAFGMMVIGCDNGTGTGDLDPALIGTWECCCGGDSYVFDRNGTFGIFENNVRFSYGTWTTSGGILTLQGSFEGMTRTVVFSYTIVGGFLTLDYGDGYIQTFTRRQ